MTAADRFAVLAAVVATVAAVAAGHAAAATLDGLPGDGWYSWRTTAAPEAPAFCCCRRDAPDAAGAGCDLDARYGGYGNRRDDGGSGEIRIYVLRESGRTADIRVLSADCTVTADATITDLDEVAVADSVHWLEPYVDPDSRLAGDALAAVAMHDGTVATELLVRTAEHADKRQLRLDAMFWLAQSGAAAAESTIGRVLRNDGDRRVREQAVFALSGLPGERAVRALIAVLEDLTLDVGVRKQALFWLAESGADNAYAYLDALLDGN